MLTGREFRHQLAIRLGLDEDLLSTERVQQHLDSFILEYFQTPTIDSTERPREKPGRRANKSRKFPPKHFEENAEKPTATKGKRPSGMMKPAKTNTIDRLKLYINRCGARRIWKRELSGLNETQQTEKLGRILTDLGMEGRPTLEKCKVIKKRREFEEELKALDPKNMLPTKFRSENRLKTLPRINQGNSDNSSTGEEARKENDESAFSISSRLDLTVLGDPED